MWTIGRSQRVEGKHIDLSSVKYGTLVTDRHVMIKNYMREQHPDIHHYFDVYNFLKHFADNKYYISFIQFYITINLFLLFSRVVYLLFDDNPVIGLSFIAIQCLNLRHT